MRSPAVVLLPGDGVGPEVAREARLVLELVAPDVEIAERLIGAAAIRAAGDPLPEDTLSACREATAVLKGPVGDPEFDAIGQAALWVAVLAALVSAADYFRRFNLFAGPRAADLRTTAQRRATDRKVG